MAQVDVAAGPEPGMSRAEYAYAAIRDLIVTLRLAPSAPINEEQLMAELGVGRTPIREALKRLALESLVDVYPRRGTFVSEIQITDLAAISEVRERLEGHAAALAAQRINDDDRAEFAELLAEVEAASGASVIELMEIDAHVHRLIYRAARNQFLQNTLEGYFNLAARIWHLALDRLPSMASNIALHRRLLIAVSRGDAVEAELVAAEHVRDFERSMREIF